MIKEKDPSNKRLNVGASNSLMSTLETLRKTLFTYMNIFYLFRFIQKFSFFNTLKLDFDR